MTTMRAAIYVRQSIDKEMGIERQVARCRKLIEAREWVALPPYEDNSTSAYKERGEGTAWRRMLHDIEAGLIDVVVAVDVDRLLRSTADLAPLTKGGVKVLTVNGELDLTSANGEMMAGLFATLARFEVRVKSERQLRANERRVELGKPVPSRRRYGFETDGLTPREEEAQHVAGLFHDFNQGASIRTLAKRMGWRTGRVRELLANPAYWGQLRSKGVVYDAPTLLPLVSPVLAADVQLKLNDPTRRTSPGPEPKHLASGLAVCGVCGATMYYMRDYRCKDDPSHPCIKKHILDPLIAEHVAEVLMTEPLNSFDVDTGLTGLYDAMRANEKAQAAYHALMDDGRALSVAARKKLRDLEDDAARILAKIDLAKAQNSTSRILAELRGDLWMSRRPSLVAAGDAAERIASAFLAADIEPQRELVRGLLRVIVNPGRGAGRVIIERREDPQDAAEARSKAKKAKA